VVPQTEVDAVRWTITLQNAAKYQFLLSRLSFTRFVVTEADGRESAPTVKRQGNRAASVTGNRGKVAEVVACFSDSSNSSKRTETFCNCGGTYSIKV
jgi:hypothetical protein